MLQAYASMHYYHSAVRHLSYFSWENISDKNLMEDGCKQRYITYCSSSEGRNWPGQQDKVHRQQTARSIDSAKAHPIGCPHRRIVSDGIELLTGNVPNMCEMARAQQQQQGCECHQATPQTLQLQHPSMKPMEGRTGKNEQPSRQGPDLPNHACYCQAYSQSILN